MITVNAMIQFREIDSPATPPPSPSDKLLQRANGLCRIVVDSSKKGNQIVDVFQRSPLRVIFPRMSVASAQEAVLINTAGGIAGGDRLECEVTAVANASIAVTTQTAERVYRALDEPARAFTKLKVSGGARLAWLPQETIIFNWARFHRETEIEISSRAELLALEWLVFGRAAHGEQLLGGQLIDQWRVRNEGRLIWAESFRVGEEVFRHLNRRAVLSDCKAVATLIYCGPELGRRVNLLRDIAGSLKCYCAVTSVGGLIIVRLAADASSNLKLALVGFLRQLGTTFGPGPFRVPKMWLSC